MKKKLLLAFITFQILFVLYFSCYTAYSSYCEFYKIKMDSSVARITKKLVDTKFIDTYGSFSGCNTGYGFFAPNVRSTGTIQFENGNNTYYPKFKTNEAENRFSVFVDKISDFLLEDEEEKKVKNKNDSVKVKYYNLLYKAVAARLFNENMCNNKVSYISYNLYDYPSLQQYTKGEKLPQFLRLYQIETILDE